MISISLDIQRHEVKKWSSIIGIQEQEISYVIDNLASFLLVWHIYQSSEYSVNSVTFQQIRPLEYLFKTRIGGDISFLVNLRVLIS